MQPEHYCFKMNLSTNPHFTHGIEKLCTICHVILRDTDTSQSIFSTLEELESPMNILQVLQSFSNFNFYNRAQMVCTTCYDKIIEVYKFIQMCNKAHDNMQHYFKNIEAIKTIQDFERDELDLNVKIEPTRIIIDGQEFIEEMENEKIEEMEMVICDTEIKIEDTIFQGMEKEETSSNEEIIISHTEIVTEENADSRTKFNLRSHDQGYNANLEHISEDLRLNQDRHQPLRDHEQTHNRVHTGENSFTCDFAAHSSLGHICNVVEAHKCEQCGRQFNYASNLRRHMNIHNGVKPHKCEQCDRRFTQAQHLRTHMNIHNGVKPHKCEQCGRRFTQASDLHRHMDIHTGVKAHKCEQCDRRFTRAANLRSHMDSHNGVKAYKCEQCNQQFNYASNLRRHMKIHNGVNPHKCEQCDRRFTQAHQLRTHMNIHNGVKPHKCEQCGRRFTQASDLHRHMDIHTGVKAHKCEQCDRRFTRAADLRTHMDIHNGVKAHKCEQCDRQFTRSSALRRHMKTHYEVKRTNAIGDSRKQRTSAVT